MPHSIPRVAALLALALTSSLAVAAENSARLGPYQVRFDPVPPQDQAVDSEYASRSVVTITRASTAEVWTKEWSAFEPGCGAIPAVSSVGDRYLALCGHLGGRHYTYRLMRIGGGGTESATLDAFDQASPLIADAHGAITTLVLRRDVFPGELVGPIYFPYVYAVRSDASTFGFEPVFGANVKAQYMSFYDWTLANKDRSEFLPVLLASLVATQDKAVICRGVKELKKQEREKNGKTDTLDKALRTWSARLPTIGYPKFNLNHC